MQKKTGTNLVKVETEMAFGEGDRSDIGKLFRQMIDEMISAPGIAELLGKPSETKRSFLHRKLRELASKPNGSMVLDLASQALDEFLEFADEFFEQMETGDQNSKHTSDKEASTTQNSDDFKDNFQQIINTVKEAIDEETSHKKSGSSTEPDPDVQDFSDFLEPEDFFEVPSGGVLKQRRELTDEYPGDNGATVNETKLKLVWSTEAGLHTRIYESMVVASLPDDFGKQTLRFMSCLSTKTPLSNGQFAEHSHKVEGEITRTVTTVRV